MSLRSLKEKLDIFITFLFKTVDKSFLFQLLLFAWYVVLTYLVIKQHVFWRDDSRPLLIAIYNNSFSDLYRSMRFESTPMLYHIILWFINKFIPISIHIDKMFFFAIYILTIFIIVFLLKIPNSFKLLILLLGPQLGYLNYIRQYSFSVFFIFLFTYLLTSKKKNSLLTYLTLFLLTQTSFHGCIIAITYLILIIVENYYKDKKILWGKYCFTLTGVLLCAIQMIHPKELAIRGLYNFKLPTLFDIASFIISFVSDIFLNGLLISYAFYILIWYLVVHFYKSNKIIGKAYLFYVLFLFSTFLYIGLSGHSFDRHHWLFSYAVISISIIMIYTNKVSYTRTSYIKYWLLFSIFAAGLTFYSRLNFVCLPISSSKYAAYFLDNLIVDKFILGRFEFCIDAIVPYRKNLRPYYGLGRHEVINYTVWDHKKVDYCDYIDRNRMTFNLWTNEVLYDLNKVETSILDSEPILILGSDRIVRRLKHNLTNVKIKNKYRMFFIGDFSGSLTDNYRIYLIKKIGSYPLNFLNHNRPKSKVLTRKVHSKKKSKISTGEKHEKE